MDQQSKKRVVLAGGSGFIGLKLAEHLSELGFDVVILSRNKPTEGPWSFCQWDGRTLGDWARVVDGAHAVVNLAGRSVDCVKTPLHIDQVLRSRVESTRVLGDAVHSAETKPAVWVQMSIASIHGDSELECDETSAYGYGFAPTIGVEWEKAFAEKCPNDVRQVVLRISFVLGNTGVALKKLRFITKLGLGGTISTGRQGMSWIHEDDMIRIIERAITNESMNGAYIASSPNPLSNRDFMRQLRKTYRMPIGLPAAGWMIRFAARFILRTDAELALYGRYCIPQRLIDEGYEFAFGELDDALSDLRRKQ